MPEDRYNSDEINAIKASEQAKWFLTSPIGRKLTEKAQDEAMDALTELGEADPHDPKRIIELQVRKRVAEKALAWIFEIVAEGDQIEELADSVDDIDDNL